MSPLDPSLLLIDGDADAPELAKSLAALPARVRHAPSIDAALADAPAEAPALVLLNLALPDATGLDALRTLRYIEPYARVPVVLLATAPTEEVQIAAYELGIEEILAKPIAGAVLAARIRTMLARLERTRDLEPHPGMLFDGRYRVVRPLGRGGMGSVYLVEPTRGATGSRTGSPAPHPMLALKLFHRENADRAGQIDRFLREVQVLACLEHPHLIKVHDSGVVDGRGYYCMDYLDGGSLHDLLAREGRLSPVHALEITEKVARALALAHDHELLHRDLKPDNILFDRAGEPVVTDFGLVFDASAARQRRITDSGIIVGTPHYMSPEQILSPTEIDSRSDVFSLGIILYELLTGDVPFGHLSGIDAMLKLAREDITPPIYVAPDIGSGPNMVCMGALRRSRTDRYPSAEALADAAARVHAQLVPHPDA